MSRSDKRGLVYGAYCNCHICLLVFCHAQPRISEFNKKPRVSKLAPLGDLDSSSEAKIFDKPFRFQKQAGIRGRQLTYITIADTMVKLVV